MSAAIYPMRNSEFWSRFDSTPLPIISEVSRVVTMTVDRIAGDRGDYPLLVSAAVKEALLFFGISSQVMYGPSAWIEILEDQSAIWAGCWNGNFNFWVASQYGEVIDLNTSIAFRKKPQSPQYDVGKKSLFSPPILWSKEVPKFYRYLPEGIAELELNDEAEQKRFSEIQKQIPEKLKEKIPFIDSAEQFEVWLSPENHNLDFPNEPILCPGRRLLDDSKQSFMHFDRALGVGGIPPSPI